MIKSLKKKQTGRISEITCILLCNLMHDHCCGITLRSKAEAVLFTDCGTYLMHHTCGWLKYPPPFL